MRAQAMPSSACMYTAMQLGTWRQLAQLLIEGQTSRFGITSCVPLICFEDAFPLLYTCFVALQADAEVAFSRMQGACLGGSYIDLGYGRPERASSARKYVCNYAIC